MIDVKFDFEQAEHLALDPAFAAHLYTYSTPLY